MMKLNGECVSRFQISDGEKSSSRHRSQICTCAVFSTSHVTTQTLDEMDGDHDDEAHTEREIELLTLLRQRERDLALAAELGSELHDENQQLQQRIEQADADLDAERKRRSAAEKQAQRYFSELSALQQDSRLSLPVASSSTPSSASSADANRNDSSDDDDDSLIAASSDAASSPNGDSSGLTSPRTVFSPRGSNGVSSSNDGSSGGALGSARKDSKALLRLRARSLQEDVESLTALVRHQPAWTS